MDFEQSVPKEILEKMRELELQNRQLLEQNNDKQRTLIMLERKLTKFNEIKEQRDWLLDEMTKKISELSRFQSDLFKAERLSAIGEMAARLAHDIRNPLAIIKNTVEIVKLKHSANTPAELMNLFASIDNATSRIVFQLDEVLNFVRSSPLRCDLHSLYEIMESAISKIVIPDQISIHKPTHDIYVFCDMEKIAAVFTNLIMNAIQAMENNGDIIIRFDESEDAVTFSVQDSGPGIPPNLVEKIFEPLFTTKSRGTGLGLPAVKTIVQQHQGTITVHNNPTVFSVSLPKNLTT
ncbi:MAG TPA: ATP-binding protein [Candidatus Nitrosotenuis sp.]|nr:ATP-binding protein [Candidatus Nitrosotenuis sp.]